MIDLRSDTVTKPTPAMRKAMADAEVGDDVLGEDPTVAELEHTTAELLGSAMKFFLRQAHTSSSMRLEHPQR